jgi:hypothetical protein
MPGAGHDTEASASFPGDPIKGPADQAAEAGGSAASTAGAQVAEPADGTAPQALVAVQDGAPAEIPDTSS